MYSSDSLELESLWNESKLCLGVFSLTSTDFFTVISWCDVLYSGQMLMFLESFCWVADVRSNKSFKKWNILSDSTHCLMWASDTTVLNLDWVIKQVFVRRALRNISKAREMMTGTAFAIRPTSVSFCMIFLIRLWTKNKKTKSSAVSQSLRPAATLTSSAPNTALALG